MAQTGKDKDAKQSKLKTIWFFLKPYKLCVFGLLVLAAIIHNQFEHIHPFQDGNGRVGRLLLNYVLLQNRYPPINILLEDRLQYYKTLQEYSKNQNLKPTIKFLVEQYNKMTTRLKKM